MRLIIFGASGDLAKKKLLPAISELEYDRFEVIGYARSDFGKNYCLELRKYFNYKSSFLQHVNYIQGEYNDLGGIKSLIDEDTILYLSVPPKIHSAIFKEIKGLMYNKVVVEKPFGIDLKSFQIYDQFPEDKILFIDHYLSKPLSIALPSILSPNEKISRMINTANIESIECRFDESILAEGRAYFDSNGTFRDVIQNHLVMIFASIVYQVKKDTYGDRLSFLKTLKTSKSFIPTFGQYNGYSKEFERETMTETFARLHLECSDPFLKGKPIILSGGKGLDKKNTEVIFNISGFENDDPFKPYLRNTDFSKISGVRLVFNFAPDNIVFLEFQSEGKIHKDILIASESIDKIKSEHFGAGVEYETLFKCLTGNIPCPSVTLQEARMLWQIFNDFLLIEKKIKYYDVGDSSSKI